MGFNGCQCPRNPRHPPTNALRSALPSFPSTLSCTRIREHAHTSAYDASGALRRGGTGSAGPRAAMACLNTQISAATGSLSWMCTEWFIRKRPSVLGIISGALAVPFPPSTRAWHARARAAALTVTWRVWPVCMHACVLKKLPARWHTY